MALMATTSFVFIRMRRIQTWARQAFRGRNARPTNGAGSPPNDDMISACLGVGGLDGRACDGVLGVFLELILQRLEADAKDLGGPRLVVVGGLQGFENEQALGFLNRGSDAQTDRVGFLH